MSDRDEPSKPRREPPISAKGTGIEERLISGRSEAAVRSWLRLGPALVIFYAFLCAIVIGGFVMVATEILNDLQDTQPGVDFAAALVKPFEAYWSLLRGAVGSGDRVASSLARSTPFVGAALSLAFAFKAGLFNIGAEGQLLIGALFGGWAGTWAWLEGAPAPVAITVVVLMGALGGAIWGGIPGLLKARTGAHEVIVTIMLNTIALRLLEWLVLSRDPVILLDETSSVPHSREIVAGARLPGFDLASGATLHAGLLLAVGMCALMWFVMNRTTTGFEIKAVGLNPDAATYAGMSVGGTWILVMAGSGAFAGVAGAGEVAGAVGFIQPGVFRNIGFDSIAIALLARANPFAIIPAAILWGSLLSGAPLMQLEADLSIDLVRIVQAMILLFVAADVIVRRLFRLKIEDEGLSQPVLTSGWGS